MRNPGFATVLGRDRGDDDKVDRGMPCAASILRRADARSNRHECVVATFDPPSRRAFPGSRCNARLRSPAVCRPRSTRAVPPGRNKVHVQFIQSAQAKSTVPVCRKRWAKRGGWKTEDEFMRVCDLGKWRVAPERSGGSSSSPLSQNEGRRTGLLGIIAKRFMGSRS